MDPYQRTPFSKVPIELLDTEVFSGSVTRGSDRWRFLGNIHISKGFFSGMSLGCFSHLSTQKQVLGHLFFQGNRWILKDSLDLPPPPNRHHHDSYMFSRESQSKPLFATVPGGNFPMRFKFFKLGCAYRDKQISKWHGEQRVAAGWGVVWTNQMSLQKWVSPPLKTHFFFP